MKPVSSLMDQALSANRTLTRQTREACTLSRDTLRAMPLVPILEPDTALKVGVESTRAFGRAYIRWLREWRDLYRSRSE